MKRKEKQRDRGSFILSFGTSKLCYKDAEHFGNACMKLSRGRFASALDFMTYARALPNGYSSYLERTE